MLDVAFVHQHQYMSTTGATGYPGCSQSIHPSCGKRKTCPQKKMCIPHTIFIFCTLEVLTDRPLGDRAFLYGPEDLEQMHFKSGCSGRVTRDVVHEQRANPRELALRTSHLQGDNYQHGTATGTLHHSGGPGAMGWDQGTRGQRGTG